MNERQGETTQALIESAGQHGYRVTAVMLKKWHLFGLLSSPKTPGLGRPSRHDNDERKRGSETVYPPGTSAQLLRLLAIRAEGGRFKPERALWRLWWEGWPVNPEKIRVRLMPDLTLRDAGDFLHTLATETLPPPLAGMRKRASTEVFVSLMEFMFRVMGNKSAASWRIESGIQALYKAGGLGRLRRSVSDEKMPDFGGNAQPSGVKPIALSVMALWAATSREARHTAILEADADALEHARHDLCTIATVTRQVWPVISSLTELDSSNAGRDLIAHYQQVGFDALPDAVGYVLALRRVQSYAAMFDALSEHADSIAVVLEQAIRQERQTMKKPPRRLEPSGGTTQGDKSPCTTILASPSIPPAHETVS